jgi:hypothetical protein
MTHGSMRRQARDQGRGNRVLLGGAWTPGQGTTWAGHLQVQHPPVAAAGESAL